MRDWVLVVLLAFAVSAFLVPTSGCDCLVSLCPLLPSPTPPPDDNGDNGDNGDVDNGDDDDDDDDDGDDDGPGCDECLGGCDIVKTDIALRADAGLRVGNDLIAFGTGVVNGVSYIIPSADPTEGIPVPNSDSFRSKGFAVGGRTIFLVDGMFQVSVLNVDVGGDPITIPQAEIRLQAITVGANDVGHIQADGDYCVTRNDTNTVDFDNVLRVIDASGAAPVVILLNNPPGVTTGFGVQQVAIDAATMRVIAAAGNSLYVYEDFLTAPTEEPVEIPLPNGISNSGQAQMRVSGDYLIALDNRAFKQAFLVNLVTQDVIELPGGEASGFGVAIGGDNFAFFADLDAGDRAASGQRAAVGDLPGPGFTKAPPDQQINGAPDNIGLLGFAGSMCMTPDGSCLYLANPYLQYRTTGAAFAAPADPYDGGDTYAFPAWDIHCSANTVGFKTAETRMTATRTVGYIRLGDPD